MKTREVAVIGAGATGGALAFGLSRWWPKGRVHLIDDDTVERSNLPRQPWFTDDALGAFKVDALIQALAPGGCATLWGDKARLTEDNAEALLAEADIVLDGSDNWETREVIQAWAFSRRRPWVYTSVLAREGMCALFEPGAGPCLYCLFSESLQQGPQCFESGVLGPVALAVAGQALAVWSKWDAGRGDGGTLWLVDGITGQSRPVASRPVRCQHGPAV